MDAILFYQLYIFFLDFFTIILKQNLCLNMIYISIAKKEIIFSHFLSFKITQIHLKTKKEVFHSKEYTWLLPRPNSQRLNCKPNLSKFKAQKIKESHKMLSYSHRQSFEQNQNQQSLIHLTHYFLTKVCFLVLYPYAQFFENDNNREHP